MTDPDRPEGDAEAPRSEVGATSTDHAFMGPSPDGGDKRIDRREALKKAAIGGAVAGAAWVSPRVEGLSLVPDYASAGTVVGGAVINFRINSSDNSNGGDGNNYYITNNDRNNRPTGLNGCTGSQDWLIAVNPQNTGNPVPVTISPGFPANSASNPVTMSAPLGPAGNVVVTIPGGTDGDIPGGTPYTAANVAFTIDPPFNRCRVISANATRCNPDSPGALPLSINNNPSGPTITNPAPFTATVVFNAPTPGNLGEMNIQVQCS